MSETLSERYIRAERTVYELMERLPKEVIGQVARALAMNIAHYQAQTGVDIPLEETMMILNAQSDLDEEARQALATVINLASILVWMSGETTIPPGPGQSH